MEHTLIPSDRVEAAAVYSRDGQKIGTIERLMLEKKAGTVAYAVVKCGGFLKAGTHHYPLPWSSLKWVFAESSG
jgi:sporulation protein YlmC with PRC-barrel domain